MRAISWIPALFVVLALAAGRVGAQDERPGGQQPPPGGSGEIDVLPPPGQQQPPSGQRPPGGPPVEVTPRPDHGGEEARRAEGDGSLPDGQVLEAARPAMEGHEALHCHAFTEPEPLPQGGRGHLYFALDVPAGRFITRGPEDTLFKFPPQTGPLSLGAIEWPRPQGHFPHPSNRAAVPGWTGQVFLRIPVQVAAGAPLGPVVFKIDYQYRVLLADPPTASVTHIDPIEFRALIGPPLPQVTVPPRGRTLDTAPAAAAGTERPEPDPGTGAGGEGREPGGRGELAPPPGAPAEEPVGSQEPLPALPGAGNLLQNGPLVLGLAGLLALLALLLLAVRGKRS